MPLTIVWLFQENLRFHSESARDMVPPLLVVMEGKEIRKEIGRRLTKGDDGLRDVRTENE